MVNDDFKDKIVEQKEGIEMKNYPFPFFGAGTLRSFGDADCVTYYVFFESYPSAEQYNKIGELIPDVAIHPAYKTGIKQGAVEGISIYPTMYPAAEILEKTYVGVSDPFEAFKNDMEKAFIAINEVAPIKFVAVENIEITHQLPLSSRKNNLSSWHFWSLSEADDLLDTLKEEPYKSDLLYSVIIGLLFAYMNAENIESRHDIDAFLSSEDDDDDDDRAGELFYDEYHPGMTSAARDAVIEALKTLQQLKEEENFGHLEINVSMDYDAGTIDFWYMDEDNDKESEFYSHAVGSFMQEAFNVMEQMEEEGGTPYSQALSNFFEDAGLSSIGQQYLNGLSFTLNVPDVGGDPYLEYFSEE